MPLTPTPPSLLSPVGPAGRHSRNSLLRRLALVKLRELRRAGLGYREIGRRYGAPRGAGEPDDRGFVRRLSPDRLLTADGTAGGAGLAVGGRDLLLFLRALDGVAQPLAFFDGAGRLLHANPALTRLLEREDGERLLQEVQHFALTLWSLVRLRALEAEKCSEGLDAREVSLGAERLQLRGSYLGLDLFGGGGSVLVTIETPPPDPLAVEALRVRFGLSRRESRVAQLLVEGCSNAEIAARLGISPHTARHHTEHVLRKLGVHSRAEAVARLLRG